MFSGFSIYQLLLPLVSLLMILRAISRFGRARLSGRELLFWVLFWLLVSIAAIFPEVTINTISTVTGIKSGINALIFFALVVLAYASLYLFVQQEKIQRQLTDLVRAQALRDFEDEKNAP